MDLPLIASSLNFHFFIWTYLWLPVLLSSLFFTYLDLPLSANLIVLWLYHSRLPDWTYTSDASLVDIFWKTPICLNYLLSSEGLSEAFIGCKTLFYPTSLFWIWTHISDAMCPAMYDCAWMKYPSIHFFIWICFIPFHLSLFSTKCRMQMLCPNYADEMPWSVSLMWYANIVP